MDAYLAWLIAGSSWFFLLLGAYTMTFELVPKWLADGFGITYTGVFMIGLFYVFFFNAIISHLRATFMEPGYTPKFPVPFDMPLELVRYCEYCDQWKPDRTHHCRACKKCIHRMDHHCPWINNCVGARNQKFFCLFLFYVFCCCFQTLAIMAYISFTYFGLKDKSFRGGLVSLLVAVFTGVIASVFVIFTAIMFYDQIEVVVNNQTEVEKMSNKAGKTQSIYVNFQAAFGQNWINWLNPLVNSPEPDYSEMLFLTTNNLKQQ
jgi:palmitoyltransferase